MRVDVFILMTEGDQSEQLGPAFDLVSTSRAIAVTRAHEIMHRSRWIRWDSVNADDLDDVAVRESIEKSWCAKTAYGERREEVPTLNQIQWIALYRLEIKQPANQDDAIDVPWADRLESLAERIMKASDDMDRALAHNALALRAARAMMKELAE